MRMTRSEELEYRAMQVLGITKRTPSEKIRSKYHCRIFKHHPDRNPDDPNAEEISRLINESYSLLTKKDTKTSCLENDYLVKLVVNDPITPIDEFSYDRWLKERFYGKEGLIWPDNNPQEDRQSSIRRSERSKKNIKKVGHHQSYEKYASDRGFFDFVKPDQR